MRAWRTAAIVGAGNFKDPQNARIIYLAAAGLVVLAVGLAISTFLWWRHSKVEHPVLGPLEVMGTRRWWKSDFATRTMRLEQARPSADGDEPVDGPVVEPVDLLAMMSADPDDFADLADPSPAQDDTSAAELPVTDDDDPHTAVLVDATPAPADPLLRPDVTD